MMNDVSHTNIEDFLSENRVMLVLVGLIASGKVCGQISTSLNGDVSSSDMFQSLLSLRRLRNTSPDFVAVIKMTCGTERQWRNSRSSPWNKGCRYVSIAQILMKREHGVHSKFAPKI